MTDTTTLQPIRVLTDTEDDPYFKLPYAQVDRVRSILETNSIRFWVDRHVISFDGKPYVASIWIGRGTDPRRVQALLDAVE